MLGRGVPQYLAVESSMDSVQVRWRATEKPGIFLKGPGTESLPHKTCPKLQRGDRSLRSARYLRGETELSGFRWKTGGATLLRTRATAGSFFFFWSPSVHSHQTKARSKSESPLTRLTPLLPDPGDSQRPHCTQI